jgi:hypothetical protein
MHHSHARRPHRCCSPSARELQRALQQAIAERDEALAARRFWIARFHYAVTGETLTEQ